MRDHTATAALALCVVSVLSGSLEPASAQEPLEEFDQVVDVRVVNVDVYVTDREGNPVTGLTREDFSLEVDGQPIELSNFYAVEGREVVPADPAPTTADGGAQPSQRSAPDAPPAPTDTPVPQPTWLALYVDNANIKALNRTRVLRDVRRFLYEQGDEFDHILLASYEGSLHIRQPFTRDPQKVVRALEDIAKIQPFGDAEEDELFELIRQLEDRDAQRHRIAHRVEAYAQQRENELRRALEPFRSLLDSFAGLPGRRVMLYVSDGVPMNPGEELFNALQLRFEDIGSLRGIVRYSAEREFESLSVAANSAGVTLYALDATGLTAPIAGDVEAVGSGVDNLRSTLGSVRTANMQAPLRKLAGETGGLAFLNSNRFGDELRRLARDARTYYSLGFRPPHAADGRFHRIRVEVRRRGVTVRHRNGYRDEPIDTRMEQAVEAGLRWDVAENPFGVDVRAARTPAAGDDGEGETVVLPLEISLPLDSILLLERGSERIGRLEIALAVRNVEGDSSPVQHLDLPIAIPAEAYARGRGQRYVHELELRVRPGRQRVAVSVWDVLAQQGSTAVSRLSTAD